MSTPAKTGLKQVVILGGGFTGVSAAREFERIARKDIAVTLISPENFQLFTPMLPEVASGSLDMRSIAHPLRVALKRSRFILGEATDADFDAKTVTIRHPVLATESPIPFDHLIIALGAETSTLGVSGVAKYAYPLKSLPDAARIRARVGSAFEAAAAATDRVIVDRLLRFIIVGGGFTGVEGAGELAAFVKRLVALYPRFKGVTPEIILIDSGPHLLAKLPDKFGKRAASSLHARGVVIKLHEKAQSIDADGLTLKSGKRFESGTIIWTAGVEPAPFVKKLGLQTTDEGALIVKSDLSIPGRPGIWAAGDCAHVLKKGGGSYPPLAQVAVREGPVLARNIVASIAGRPTKSFRYQVAGMMASLGAGDAIAELPAA
ncbi:MAG: NAD(P)/FAD-dependent oxidoreductase [Candidatus Eremiobacteraeota bacterium]|nr:NAD(P)/FAD-dependent oxidoreductase [Candidatus Eremiobacteraeota bacterium]